MIKAIVAPERIEDNHRTPTGIPSEPKIHDSQHDINDIVFPASTLEEQFYPIDINDVLETTTDPNSFETPKNHVPNKLDEDTFSKHKSSNEYITLTDLISGKVCSTTDNSRNIDNEKNLFSNSSPASKLETHTFGGEKETFIQFEIGVIEKEATREEINKNSIHETEVNFKSNNIGKSETNI